MRKIFCGLKKLIIFVSIMAYETIEKEHLDDITAKIKTQYPNWATIVAERISKEKEWKDYSGNPCTEQNVRHIVSCNIKSQLHRRLFMKAAAQMLLEVAQSHQDVKETLEQVNES